MMVKRPSETSKFSKISQILHVNESSGLSTLPHHDQAEGILKYNHNEHLGSNIEADDLGYLAIYKVGPKKTVISRGPYISSNLGVKKKQQQVNPHLFIYLFIY